MYVTPPYSAIITAVDEDDATKAPRSLHRRGDALDLDAVVQDLATSYL